MDKSTPTPTLEEFLACCDRECEFLVRDYGFERLLKEHAADFLNGDVRRFEAALAEWKRVTRPRPVSEAQRLDRQRQTAVTEAGHASRRGNHAEVVRLLEPLARELSLHQTRMLEAARQKLKDGDQP